MCRHLAYLGPPTAVGELLTRGAHSLRTQSWAPKDMRRGGTINADGFGVAWWPPGQPPTRYRNSTPIWTDPAVDEVLPQLSSTAVLAAVRSATVGMPVERSACAPFTEGWWAFSHNGVIPNWRTVLPLVAKEFGSPDLLEAESATDSAALWVILRAALRARECGTDGRSESAWEPSVFKSADEGTQAQLPGDTELPSVGRRGDEIRRTWETLVHVTQTVLDYAPDARLNLLLADGESIWATTVYHSLSVLATDEFVVVASEPYDDDPRWIPVDDRQVVFANPGRLAIEPLHSALSAGPESERPLS